MAVGTTQPFVIIDLKINQLLIYKVYDAAKMEIPLYFSEYLLKNRYFLVYKL